MKLVRLAKQNQAQKHPQSAKISRGSQNTESYFRFLLEHSADAISLRDKKGNILYITPSVSKIFGYTEEEYKQIPQWSMFHPEDLTHFKKTFKQVYSHPGKTFGHRVRLRHKDGTWRWIEANITNLFHEPSVKAIVVNFRDISQIKLAEETIKSNEQKLQLITEAVPTLITYVDEQERYRFTNKAYQDWFGYTKEALEGAYVKDVVGENAYKDIEQYVKKALSGKTVTYESFLTYREGKEKYVLATYIPHFGEKKHVLGFYAIITDISTRKKAEDKLQESEKRFRKMTDSAPVMVWMADTQKQGIYFNKVWYDFTGRTLQQELGEGWFDGIHPEDRERCLMVYTQAMEARKDFKIEYRLRHADGEYRWVLVNGTPLATSNGVFTGYIGSAIDISERIELEQRKDDFLSIASHELKTPVTSIKAYTQVLNYRFKKAGDIRSAELVTKMDSQLTKLTSLINDLLDVTKIEAGKLVLNQEYFDFNELALEIIEEIQRTTNDHQIIAKLTRTKIVYGDRDRIGQVLTNFITNAIKYSPSSEEIIVRTVFTHSVITASVQDFGVGIPKRKQPMIFDRFFRVDESKQETYPGLGLGLFISSDIIKRHHGSIWFTSKRGKGSIFYFSLPLKYAQDKLDTESKKHSNLYQKKDAAHAH